MSSKGVPGGMPPSGSPSSGSKINPQGSQIHVCVGGSDTSRTAYAAMAGNSAPMTFSRRLSAVNANWLTSSEV